MTSEFELKEILLSIENRIRYLESRLEKTDIKTTLGYQSYHGRRVFVLESQKDNCRSRVFLKEDDPRIELSLQAVLVKEELKTLSYNKKIIESALNGLRKNNPTDTVLRLQKKYPKLSAERILGLLNDNPSDNVWENEAYEKFDGFPEKKIHMTSRGLLVRSKSELIIAEKLYQYELPFHYEEVLHSGKAAIVPDFTVRRRDGKIYYWEHQGRTDQENYLDHQEWKNRVYKSLGIGGWDNLIVTYDTKDGKIDLRVVEFMIKHYLLETV